MNKAYNRINWENYPSDSTPLNESNLNRIDSATDTLDNRVISLDNTKATKTEVATLVQDVTFEEKTGIITITKKNGSKVTIDTQMEKIAVNFDYDATTQKIILTLIDGTKQYIDLAALITQYEFLGTETIAFSIDSAGKVSAIVKEASIKEKHLQPNYLADIKVETAKAAASQKAAATSESNAKTSETNSKNNANNASASATKAQSYAVGGTNSRAGENTDNAKYYSQQAAEKQNIATSNANTAILKASEAAKSAEAAKASENVAIQSANTASEKAKSATDSATSASNSANTATENATNSKKSAVGDTDSAKYYYEKAKEAVDGAGAVTGVKGNNETVYRTGNVNITAENIGALSAGGNAASATKATQDANGDNIIASYRKRMGTVPNNDFNNATVEGVYTYGSSTGIANAYTNGGIYGILEVFNNGYNSTPGVAGTIIHQIAFTTNNQIYFRQRINAWDWTPWKELTTKFSNGEIKVTNPAYSKGYVRAWVDKEGGNLEIQSPDGATTYQIDAVNNDIIRIFSNNSNGSHKFLTFNGKTGVLSADGGFAGNASTVNGHTVNADVPANAKFTDTNTTYSAGTGIGLSNTTFYNTGVRSIATGSTNGSVAVNTNGTVADVKVKGLNTLAYASGTWNELTGTNCTLWYNEVAVYLEISAQGVNLTEYGGTATNKTIVVLPTNVTPTKGVYLGVIAALNSAWLPLNKLVLCNINYNTRNVTLRPAEALTNVVLNLTAMFPRSLFTIT